MSVILETTRGDVVVDLYIKERPKIKFGTIIFQLFIFVACINFLKLCKMKFYNFSRFHYVERNFLAQTGDPTGTGRGGESVYGKLYGEQARFYEAEQVPILKHTKPGILSMVNVGENMIGSQFFITLGDNLDYLDKEHCVFGEVVEGHDTLLKINDAICDENHVPYQDIRITHTVVLDDPFDDPAGLEIPPLSPEPTKDMTESGRIAADEDIDDMAGKTAEEVEEMLADREAKARATILEMVGDLPSIDAAPPENVLFVCKLNPVTTDEDLMIIFSRFGKINNCEIIRDRQTGNSLQYAFIEFDNPKSCEDAYFKMDNVLIDDRRIHVDFSQSVSKIKWKGKGRGVDFVGGKSFDPNKEDYKQNKDTRIDRNQHHGAEKSKHHFQGRDAKHESKQRDQRENWSAKNERHSKDGNSYNRDYSSHRSNRPYSDRSKDRSSPSRYSSDRNPRRDYQSDRRNSGPSSEYSRTRHDPSTEPDPVN
nr:EOG090X0971 [Sida crystallina]